MIVLRLLAHREGSGNGDLDHPFRACPQEPHIFDEHRMAPPNLADDAGNVIRVAGTIQSHAGVIEVDAIERCRESIRIAFTTPG
jgi:hypothetical protein